MSVNYMDEVPEMVRFHAELLIEFHKAWRVAKDKSDPSEERSRIAHFLLEHAAKLHRYTGDDSIVDGFQQKPSEERRALVMSACGFLSLTDTTHAVQKLLSVADFDDVDLAGLADAVMRLDSASEVLSWSRALSSDLRVRNLDMEIVAALAEATDEVNGLDGALRAWGEALLPALEHLEGLRQLIRVPIREDAWWFHGAQDALSRINCAATKEIKDILTPVRGESVLQRLASLLGAGRGVPVLATAHSGTLSLGISEDADIRIIVSALAGGGLRFEMFQASTRERPAWTGTASLELWNEKGLAASWPFDESTGIADISEVPFEGGIDLKLRKSPSSSPVEVTGLPSL